jgi:membrane protease YdiL (CAAX protease family)
MKTMTFLKLFFTAILLAMLAVTIQAGMHENLFNAGRILNEPWVIATLWDAYCGFVTFYVWVAYKETKWSLRVLWFALIMCLGNIAMAVYMLIQLFRLPPDATMRGLLLRKADA